jgi:hypothetical protein
MTLKGQIYTEKIKYMTINLLEINNTTIAEVISDEIIISSTQEAVDLMMNCAYQGAESLLMKEHNFAPGFFDLKTRMAGDILQKFSTYQLRLAIIGNFEKFSNQSLRDFIFESNKAGRILFMHSAEEAKEILSRKK